MDEKKIRVVYVDEPNDEQDSITASDLREEFEIWENTGKNAEIAADYELWLEVQLLRARRRIADLEMNS